MHHCIRVIELEMHGRNGLLSKFLYNLMAYDQQHESLCSFCMRNEVFITSGGLDSCYKINVLVINMMQKMMLQTKENANTNLAIFKVLNKMC